MGADPGDRFGADKSHLVTSVPFRTRSANAWQASVMIFSRLARRKPVGALTSVVQRI
jgi:hypothetical protein